ncbi:MAG TPA: amylo-alpha-1,6-glucosidase [Ktedonosporobacter sp.]|nr:amylo-alpha-1,6-glucosidase [Ktedonosporobacter sp.]
MPITFDRSVCCDLHQTISREWLITNSAGGYSAGTVAGVLTRRQHGLLVASPPGVVTPQLLLAKLDEEVVFDQRTYNLGTNEYRDGTINPSGFVYLETFRLEAGFPVFTYHLGGIDGIMLEKRIWMPSDHNTTYIQYRVLRSSGSQKPEARRSSTGSTAGATGTLHHTTGRFPEEMQAPQRSLTLTLLPFAAYRPYNQSQHGTNKWHFQVQAHRTDETRDEQIWITQLPQGVTGCTIRAWEQAHPYHIMAVGHPESHTTFIPTGVWYWNFLHRQDATAGQAVTDDFYLPGVIRSTLWPDEEATLTIIVSAEELSTLVLQQDQLQLSYRQNVESRHFHNILPPQQYSEEASQTSHMRILPFSTTSDPFAGGEEYLDFLLQAGKHFIKRHALPRYDLTGRPALQLGQPESITILLSDYYQMERRTRDALIALPGLALATEHYDEALRVLRTCMSYFKNGLLPEHLPLPGQSLHASDYESADTTLWFFYALDHYLQVTRNYEFLEEFYHHLRETIEAYVQGTINGIRVDPQDGLVYAGQEGKALTWMNTKIDGRPITPRIGKPVEVNALWYHALSLMSEWSQHLYHMGLSGYLPSYYQELRTLCKQSFQRRFWYASEGYLYDVVDGPDGDDAALRPNQLLALSLRHSVLDATYRQDVLDAVTQHLLTPYGLRTLAPKETAYRGQLGVSLDEQQLALHQGSVWPWLLGPYIDTLLTMHYQPARSVLRQGEHLYQEYLWRKGLQLLEPFRERLNEGVLGVCPGVFDGDAPYYSGTRMILAVNVGELLRIYSILAHMRVRRPHYILSWQA